MSTYLSNPYTPQQFQPGVPLDLVMKVGMYKQAKYDQNLSNLQESVDKIGQYNIYKEADREVISGKLSNTVSKMNEFAGQDLSDSRVYNQLLGVSSSLLNDEDVYKRIAANRNHGENLKKIEAIKEKKPELYNPLNEALYYKKASEWMNNPDQKNFTEVYKPYHDTSKIEQALIKARRENPDIIKKTDGLNNWEVKQVLADDLYQTLLTGVGGQNMEQYKIEYEATNNHTVDSTLQDINKEMSENKELIDKIQYELDTKSFTYQQANMLKSQMDKAIAMNESLDKARTNVQLNQDPTQYHSFEKYVKDRLYSLAASNEMYQEGEHKADPWAMEKFKHQNALQLKAVEAQTEILKKQELGDRGLIKTYAGSTGSSGTSGAASVNFTNPELATTEFATGLGNLQIKGEASLSTRVVGALLNSPDKDPDKNGAINITLAKGQEMAFDYSGTLADQGINISPRGLAMKDKLVDYYEQYTGTPNGYTTSFTGPQPYQEAKSAEEAATLMKQGYRKVNPTTNQYSDEYKTQRQPSPGRYYNPNYSQTKRVTTPISMREFARRAASGELKTGDKNLDAQIMKQVEAFKTQGFDLSDPYTVQELEKISSDPALKLVKRKFGHMLKEKAIVGRVKVTMGTGKNSFTDDQGNIHVITNIQATADEINDRFKDIDLWQLDPAGSATDKLRKKGLISESGYTEDGKEQLYTIPVIIKVDKDLSQAQEEYVTLQRGDKEDAKIGHYRDNYLTQSDYVKKVNDPRYISEVTSVADKALETLRTEHTDNPNAQMIYDRGKEKLQKARNILKNRKDYDYREVLQAVADIEKIIEGSGGATTTTQTSGPIFKVAGEAGTSNMHPWAVGVGNEIASVLGPETTFNSVYRTDSTNAKVGGAKNSYHKLGAGIDVKPEDWSKIPEDTKKRIVEEYQVQVINEGDHIHLEPLYKGILKRYEPSGNIAESHNNPGNVKYEPWMDKYGAQPGTNGTDGGRFARFPSVDAGLTVQKKLLFDEDTIYTNLGVDEAIKKYSHKGYSAKDIYPEVASKTMRQLTQYEKDELFRRILQREDRSMYNRLVQEGKI